VHHANHFYGHAHIMGRYVGLDDPPRIWGYLQHGWNMFDGFAVGTVFAAGFPKFVYSQACARRGWAYGQRGYVVVGAPWVYLLELEPQAEWQRTAPTREGTIVYPFHGWEGQQLVGDHERYIDQIKDTEGDVPITVCLYFAEYEERSVRRLYEDAGFRVITHGERGYLWQDTDVEFLYKQLAEVRAHKRVVSNRMTSALLHGALAGAEIGVYGDPMELNVDHAILGGARKPQVLFPEMHTEAVPQDVAVEVSRQELGADSLMCPEEVIDVFGWGPEVDVPETVATEPLDDFTWSSMLDRFRPEPEPRSARTGGREVPVRSSRRF
jgi:hypothetical protein